MKNYEDRLTDREKNRINAWRKLTYSDHYLIKQRRILSKIFLAAIIFYLVVWYPIKSYFIGLELGLDPIINAIILINSFMSVLVPIMVLAFFEYILYYIFMKKEFDPVIKKLRNKK